MKNRFLLKLFAFAVIVGMAFTTSCKDYDDDINKVNSDLTALKTELNKKIDDKIAEINGTVTTLKTDLEKVKADLAKAITQEKLDAALAAYVKLEAFNTFKTDTEADLKNLKADLLKAATKEELAQLQTLLEGKITDAKNELGGKIEALETLLDLKDGKLGVIEDIKEELGTQLGKINANAGAIKDLQDFLEIEYKSLKEMDETLRGLIDKKVDIEDFNKAVEDINDKIDKQVKRLDGRINKLDDDLNIERLRINSLFTFTRQLKGLTFIPTRGLPAEKTMKLYYYAGDYTAEHVFIYRVSPSNSLLGRDFTVESLNFQITTRSADDGVNDKSTEVDVHINPEGTYMVSGKEEMQKGIKQFGDILYVPVHIVGKEACKVFGNHDWWCNEFFFGPNKLWENWENNFPAHVVKTVKNPQVDYNCSGGYDAKSKTKAGFEQNRGLSLVITTLAENIDKAEGEPAQIRIKSTEQVNTQLIPTQIKLAESRDGKGNQILDANLKERLLKFTLAEATEWAKKDESSFPNHDKNWNVLMWSGNVDFSNGPTQPGIPNPGKIDLYDYVTSFYYPQDGGDLTRKDVTENDPHRYFYAEFGKEFGTPYTDKPHYDKPVYKFRQVAYEDANHFIIIDETPNSHSYATLEGSILKIRPDQIEASRHKKIIIEVTQVNSKCEERQPVGYLVIKIADTNNWSKVGWTYDLTKGEGDPVFDFEKKMSYKDLPYYHKKCRTNQPVGQVVTKIFADNEQSVTYPQRDANLNLLTGDRWMNPINAKESWGMANGKKNPGDVDGIINQLPQVAGPSEFYRAYIISSQHTTIVPGSKKFTAAKNNHVNDTDNKEYTGVDADQAFSHVVIRYEYGANSHIIYVDDHAPAGTYEIQYKLQYKTGNVQAGPDLYLTFKFHVELRKITVERDEINWIDATTIRGTHARIHNTINDPQNNYGNWFTFDWEGYKVDLKQAFKLKQVNGQEMIITTTNEPKGAGLDPGYRPMFEFIQDGGIVAAGFEYVRDGKNYLTILKHKATKLNAAVIENKPSTGDNAAYNRLHILANQAGDLLYNYLTNQYNTAFGTHNVITKWGQTELMLKDDMERLLPIRMVTDINGECATPDKFANNNYYYIFDFNVKFERALRWMFTTVELTDNVGLQKSSFNFFTKNISTGVCRGLFDHAYDKYADGYGNLVASGVTGDNKQWSRHNPDRQAWFYGVKKPATMFVENGHTAQVGPDADQQETYVGIDYKKVEVSKDGGKTWNIIDNDYRLNGVHDNRYFDIKKTNNSNGQYNFEARWQGDHTPINKELLFRVPIINQTAIDNGFAPEGSSQNYWLTYRMGWAKVKGYAVFKVKMRP